MGSLMVDGPTSVHHDRPTVDCELWWWVAFGDATRRTSRSSRQNVWRPTTGRCRSVVDHTMDDAWGSLVSRRDLIGNTNTFSWCLSGDEIGTHGSRKVISNRHERREEKASQLIASVIYTTHLPCRSLLLPMIGMHCWCILVLDSIYACLAKQSKI
jgi:hypothetical protein